MAIMHITKDNYETLVAQSEKPVLLDFWASWCGPCRMIAPIVEQLAQERTDIAVGKIDVDAEMELAKQFQIVSIPTLILVKDGEAVEQIVGYRSRAEIEAYLG